MMGREKIIAGMPHDSLEFSKECNGVTIAFMKGEGDEGAQYLACAIASEDCARHHADKLIFPTCGKGIYYEAYDDIPSAMAHFDRLLDNARLLHIA